MLFDIILIMVTAGAVVAAANYRAKANAIKDYADQLQKALQSLGTSMSSELELSVGSMRSLVDRKFEALSMWLTSEIGKLAPIPVLTNTVDLPPPGALLAPIPDEGAAQTLAQMESAISGLVHKKARIEEALARKREADGALHAILVDELGERKGG